ncbi:MAG: nitrogen fixation protein FixH [Burkholderiales bacterium]|nr:MAG: nitrogen fixation protein FixH [Burkholderiales bacterium]
MSTPVTQKPAWREPMVWLVVGGPASVVVASFFTLGLALKHPDPPLDLHPSAQRSADDVEPADMRAHEGDVPALIARNHAATGVPGAKP